MVKDVSSIAQSMIAQFEMYNFTLSIKHLSWTHNLVLIKQVKRYMRLDNAKKDKILLPFFAIVLAFHYLCIK